AITSQRFRLRWLLGYGAALVCIIISLKSGSRAAIVTMGVLFVLIVLHAGFATKIKLVVIVAALIGGTVPFLSRATIERYLTLTPDTDNLVTAEAKFAAGSSQSRRYILNQSIVFTLRHPLFGVGPGAFAIAEEQSARAKGRRGAWLQTHNTYTQVSSEIGLPGFAIYIAILGSSVWGLNRVRRATAHDISLKRLHQMATCILLSMTIYMVNTFFTSLAFRMYMPTLVGFAAAFVCLADQELARRTGPARLRAAHSATVAAAR
ncbi:MAG TPA: O-antigen ligase family protein, partial [Bryobacteraceae bacterium]|nr:O-antigen ligase family protein [Bryobacteraceae bacterium]